MEPFNIKIGYGEKEVTLTILPTDEAYYKVIYYGAILGAIRYQADDSWELVPEEEIIAGDLPMYVHDLKADRLDVVLNDTVVDEIGEEIEIILKLND
ncbi:hypothetical protein [Pedobacter metabolipauper]|uniref:Uncharacterized protein n=1 Tax=Pedobacter metabolipauper TaxID=425513 RepID=A0A4R6SS47_9SPHI|nr:hypothetical protein [Pedobacter metabolipauper]TDQ08195.1 hypothetical protein ATK78_2701 [Pedobacter metabolipauper]